MKLDRVVDFLRSKIIGVFFVLLSVGTVGLIINLFSYPSDTRCIMIDKDGIVYSESASGYDTIHWSDIHMIGQFSNKKYPLHGYEYFTRIYTKSDEKITLTYTRGVYVDGVYVQSDTSIFVTDIIKDCANRYLASHEKSGVKGSFSHNEYIYDIGNMTGVHTNKEDTCWDSSLSFHNFFCHLLGLFLYFGIICVAFGGIMWLSVSSGDIISKIKDEIYIIHIKRVFKMQGKSLPKTTIVELSGINKRKVDELLGRMRKKGIVSYSSGQWTLLRQL